MPHKHKPKGRKGSKNNSPVMNGQPKNEQQQRSQEGFDMRDMRKEVNCIQTEEVIIVSEGHVRMGVKNKTFSSHSTPVHRLVSQPSSVTASPSRIPLYTANGSRPHHSPFHQKSKLSGNNCDVHPTARLVPANIHRQHLLHTLENHSHSSHTPSRSVPVSGRTTPNASLSSTPSSSRRPSLGHHHQALGRILNHNHLTSGRTTATDNVYFEDYMPLCALQKALKKGEVLEGILRINPKNFEDAYISAPAEEMDIYIAGISNRNRAFNGDRVAVVLLPDAEWKVWYEKLKANWNVWQHEFYGTSPTNEAAAVIEDPEPLEEVDGEVCSEPGEEMDQRDEDSDQEVEVSAFVCAVQASLDVDVEDCKELDLEARESTEEPQVTVKTKRKRKHSKKKKNKEGSEESQEEPSLVNQETAIIETTTNLTSQPQEESLSPEELKKREKTLKKKAKKEEKKQKKKEIEEKRNEKKAARKAAREGKKEKRQVKDKKQSVNGLPREILELTPRELLKYSFGKQVVQKTAKVVAIIYEIHPRVAGGKVTLIPDPQFLKFNPSDPRVPRILLPISWLPEGFLEKYRMYNLHDALFMAAVHDWPVDSALPVGSLTQHLGHVGDIEAESQAILLENEVIDEPFPDEVELDLAAKYPTFFVPEEEWKTRRDFTEDCVFTIDPSTARDLDDALSIKPLKEFVDGNQLFEAGVHIADVSYFVHEGTPLDAVAQERSTSFYLVQRVVPMLPRILCERLCSLTSGQDKMTFSVVWKMDMEGNVYETWFGRSVIRSCAQLSYEHVQQMIEEGDEWNPPQGFPCIYGNCSPKDVFQSALLLHKISTVMRKKRFDGGALKLDKIKFNFVLDQQTGQPLGFKTGHQTEANYLVEEFMLLANQSVANKILEVFPDHAFLRRHPPPDPKQIREMKKFCSSYGIDFDSSSAGSIQQFMLQIKEDSPLIHQVLSLLLLRSMKNALYFCAGAIDEDLFGHYALNMPLYTHFTSPIRRYPDIIVHRMLSAALGEKQFTCLTPKEFMMMADHCNARKTASRLVSESSQKLFLCLYIKDAKPIETAVVTHILDRAFDVLVISFGVVVRVYLDQMPVTKSSFSCQSGQKALIMTFGKGKNQVNMTVKVSQAVSVKLDAHEKEVTKLRATLVLLNDMEQID